MTLVLAAKPGLSMEMSQTKQEEQDAGPVKPTARKRWELFWRIIAGLMLLVIVWIVWVLYQITPRSVVTPLVYESQVESPGTQQSATGAVSAAASAQPAPEAAAAALAMDQAQAGVRTGAHQSSAEVQAAALENREAQLKPDGQFEGARLKLATEITTLPIGQKKIPKKPESKADGSNVR